MNRIILLFLFVFSYCVGTSQSISQRSQPVITVQDARLFAQFNFRPPVFSDTIQANLQIGLDSCGALIFSRSINSYYYRACSPKRWVAIGSGSGGGGTFQNNIIMNATAANRLGYWVNGDTIPVAGLSLDSAFKVITQKAVPPTYTQPVASISSSPTQGNREIGDTFSITLSSTFTRNHGGLSTDTTYYKGLAPLASNLDTIKNLISPVSYTVQIPYAQGACKPDNQGVINCTGRVNAGTAISSAITFTPLPKRYWGYLNSNTTPTSAQILATQGGGSELSSSRAGTFTVAVAGSDRYLYYAYPASQLALTSLTISGFQTLPAFSPPATISVTNASGYPQNYLVYINRGNPQNAGSVTFITQ
jgi:hypothetical protein